MRSSVPSLAIRHSSTFSATSENSEKLVPAPSYVAPSGYGVPGQTVVTISPPAGCGGDLTSKLVGHGAHVCGGDVVRIVVQQHISLHGAAVVLAAHRVAHVERFQHRELRDEVQGRIVVGQYLRALDAAGDGVAAAGQAVGREEGLSVAHQPRCAPPAQYRNSGVGELLPDADAEAAHHIAVLDVPRPGRRGEDV